MDIHGLTPAQLAIAPPELLTEYGVYEGNSDMLNPAPEVVQAAADFMNSVRAVKIIENTGSMSKDEFLDVLGRVAEMVQE